MSFSVHETALPEETASSPETRLLELTQLLFRLQQNLLYPPPERERLLKRSEYERARVESNLECARSMLTKLELDALHIKAPTKRVETQNILHASRDKLETMLDRIHDLRQMASDDVDEDDDSSEEEDLLTGIIQTPSESTDSISSETKDSAHVPSETPSDSIVLAHTPSHDSSNLSIPVEATPDPTQTLQTMRARPATQQQEQSSSASSPHATGRAALFANRRDPTEPRTSTATAEAILDQQRAEQDSLSESILQMASALKASSQKFSITLDADKDVLDKAGEGISKTEQSMQTARGRMNTLRKMTEGKGWWGRMMLFAWVYGMMLGLFLLVFAMPKLRF